MSYWLISFLWISHQCIDASFVSINPRLSTRFNRAYESSFTLDLLTYIYMDDPFRHFSILSWYMFMYINIILGSIPIQDNTLAWLMWYIIIVWTQFVTIHYEPGFKRGIHFTDILSSFCNTFTYNTHRLQLEWGNKLASR